jgi:GNAT superfamily N-acetyltransferase
MPESLAFAQRRGFAIDRHGLPSRLDLATFDERPFAGAVERAETQGVRFFSLADTGNTLEAREKLYELNRTTGQDIPGSDPTFPPFEDFSRSVFEASWFRADGQILAADGDRWVGLAAVGYNEETRTAYNAFTGVDRDYRGRGLALALKLLAIQRAREYGATSMRTGNDSRNAPILAINRKLGYRPLPGHYRLIRTL